MFVLLQIVSGVELTHTQYTKEILMPTSYNTLIMGASYGSLLATKLLLAGHTVKLVCLPTEAKLINKEGTRVRLPVKGRDGLVEVDSRKLPGALSAATPDAVSPSDYDLIVLAMQEPQYRSPGVRELLAAVAQAKVPCMSLMNMPPLPFLKRIPGLDYEGLKKCFTDYTVWDSFDPAVFTLCSPDPQAFRPIEEKLNVIQVALPTNFKAAAFEKDENTKILRNIQSDIEDIRFNDGSVDIELPVKLKVHNSIFVPLAKWMMLLAGNYRCIQADGMRSIKDAVHSDLELSKSVYNWVGEVCREIGAAAEDQVPFAKYANAATGLTKPSSAARALLAGVPKIERADCVVKTIAAQKGMQNDTVDETVAAVDKWLAVNGKKSKA